MSRHPSTENLLRWFVPPHLQVVSADFATLAMSLVEAKGCCVRAAIAAQDDQIPSWTDR